jgi:hypothetical protein
MARITKVRKGRKKGKWLYIRKVELFCLNALLKIYNLEEPSK